MRSDDPLNSNISHTGHPNVTRGRGGGLTRLVVCIAVLAFTMGGLAREMLRVAVEVADSATSAGGGSHARSGEQLALRLLGERGNLQSSGSAGGFLGNTTITLRPPTVVSSGPPSTSSSVKHAAPPLVMMSAACVAKVQRAALGWVACIKRTPPSDNALAWKDNNACGYTRHLYRDYEQQHAAEGGGGGGGGAQGGRWGGASIRYLMARSTMEFQGDSTLREVVGLLLSQAEVPGTLEKKDANKGLRAPKYYVKVGPLSLLHTGPLPPPPAATLTTTASPLSLAVLSRVMFRFDFLASSLSEPLVDTPLLLASGPDGSASATGRQVDFFSVDALPPRSVLFAEGSPSSSVVAHRQKEAANGSGEEARDGPAKRILVVSIASHGAKHLVVETGPAIGRAAATSDDALFGLFIGGLEDYLMERVLGLRPVRGGTVPASDDAAAGMGKGGGVDLVREKGVRELFGHAPIRPLPREERMLGALYRVETVARDASSSASSASPRLVTTAVVMGQAFECSAMPFSPNKGFKRLAPHCAAIQSIVRAAWAYWEAHSMATLQLTLLRAAEGGGGSGSLHTLLHQQSSWRSLSPSKLRVLASAVVYIPPLYCHGEGAGATASPSGGGRAGAVEDTFQFEISRPFCTKDGIHLRKKYLVQKLDGLLNALVGHDACHAAQQ